MSTLSHPSIDAQEFTPEVSTPSVERELLGLVQDLAEAIAEQNNQIGLLKRHLCLIERQIARSRNQKLETGN